MDDDRNINQFRINHMSTKSDYKHSITGLMPGTRYVIRVNAYNNAGNGTTCSVEAATGICLHGMRRDHFITVKDDFNLKLNSNAFKF